MPCVPPEQSRHAVRVTVAAADFAARARSTDARVAAVIDEHLIDNEDELLLQLLVADLGRQVRAAHDTHDFRLRDALLALLDWGLTEGDEALDNAISISFVEDTGWWESGLDEYLASWLLALTAELARQRGEA